jgi:hypothetical protein
MASPFFIAGPYNALWVAPASGSFQRISLETTGPYEFKEQIPKEYVACTGKYEQAGAKQISLTLAFLSIDDLAIKLARGLALNAPTVYGTPTQQQYSILLIDTEDSTNNLYIPCCESIGDFSFQRDKKQQSQVNLALAYQSPNLNDFMWATGTFAELAPLVPNWPL